MTKRATAKQATIARALRAVQQVGGGQIIKIEADGSITVLPLPLKKCGARLNRA